SVNMLLDEGMQVRILELDGDLDPDEYCKERGAAAYQERLEGAKGYFYWLADRARSKYDVRTSEGQVSVLQFLMAAVQRITDPVEGMVIAGDVAGYLGVERGMVLDSFKKAVAERQESKFQKPAATLRHDERILINALLTQPERLGESLAELKTLDVIATFPSRRIFQAIFALEAGGARAAFRGLPPPPGGKGQKMLPPPAPGD